jgi:hypothetical protein
VFPFYTLVDCFVTNSNVIQKGFTFLVILLQKAVINVQTVMPMLFNKLLWNQPCTDFTKVKSVMDDFIGSIE